MAKLSNLFGKVKTALDSEMIAEYRSFLAKQNMSAEDVAAGLIKLALENLMNIQWMMRLFSICVERNIPVCLIKSDDAGTEMAVVRTEIVVVIAALVDRVDLRVEMADVTMAGLSAVVGILLLRLQEIHIETSHVKIGAGFKYSLSLRNSFTDDRKNDRNDRRPAHSGRPFERDVKAPGRDDNSRRFDGPRDDRKSLVASVLAVNDQKLVLAQASRELVVLRAPVDHLAAALKENS